MIFFLCGIKVGIYDKCVYCVGSYFLKINKKWDI